MKKCIKNVPYNGTIYNVDANNFRAIPYQLQKQLFATDCMTTAHIAQLSAKAFCEANNILLCDLYTGNCNLNKKSIEIACKALKINIKFHKGAKRETNFVLDNDNFCCMRTDGIFATYESDNVNKLRNMFFMREM